MHPVADKFRGLNIQVLGISTDQPFSQKAFSKSLGLDFPLLSDRDRRVTRAYGVYNKERNGAERAYFLISKEGRILWRHVMADPAKKLDIETLVRNVKDNLS